MKKVVFLIVAFVCVIGYSFKPYGMCQAIYRTGVACYNPTASMSPYYCSSHINLPPPPPPTNPCPPTMCQNMMPGGVPCPMTALPCKQDCQYHYMPDLTEKKWSRSLNKKPRYLAGSFISIPFFRCSNSHFRTLCSWMDLATYTHILMVIKAAPNAKSTPDRQLDRFSSIAMMYDAMPVVISAWISTLYSTRFESG